MLNGAIKSFPYQYFEISAEPSAIPISAVQEANLKGKQNGIIHYNIYSMQCNCDVTINIQYYSITDEVPTAHFATFAG